jgi:iron complex transport system ATP-binding protein
MEGIEYRRGDAHILKGISWRVAAGEHWAVVGANGSGKTSLMMIATGYEPASGGEVFLIEGDIGDIVLPDVRKKIGFVSSQLTEIMVRHRPRVTGLETALSGRYASLGLYEKPSARAVRDAKRILAELGAAHLAEIPFSKMSTGQRQVCLVARCYMTRSRLVILDEPCAGLDLATREIVLRTLTEEIRRHPATPQILVTHHPEEIVPGITHVLLLRAGEVVAQGEREKVLTKRNLERAYGVPLRVVHQDGRVWIVPRRNERTPNTQHPTSNAQVLASVVSRK